MRIRVVLPLVGLGFSGLVAAAVASSATAESKTEPLPSRYAPASDLRRQIDNYVKRIETALSNETNYGADQQGAVEKDASTLAAMALVLGMHDQDHPFKKSAKAMIDAAGSLADSAGDFESAGEAFGQFKQAMEAGGETAELQWEPVASLASLMQQVPIVNNALRRSVNGRRFKREADKAAALAAALAAIAQASIADTDYCEDEEHEKKWRAINAEMRDAAGDVIASIRKQDQNSAKVGLQRIAKTCDACHHDFRD